MKTIQNNDKNINRDIINAYEYTISIDNNYKPNIKSALYRAISDFLKALKGFRSSLILFQQNL